VCQIVVLSPSTANFGSVCEEKKEAAKVRPLHDSAFSRTVWRLYGGAKGLGIWY
jgi:hypothetical protein